MLSGVFAPLVTPFRNDEIYYEGLMGNIERMNGSGLGGYFVLGANGEYKSLSVPERVEVLKTVAKSRSPEKVLMAGTGMDSTKETIDMTLRAAEIGVDMVSLLMPHFFAKRIEDDILSSYISEVADRSPVPVMIYNNPSVAAGVLVSTEVIKRVSEHQNVVGMKDSSKGNFKSYLDVAKGNFHVLAGSASFFYDLLQAGGIRGVLSLVNVFPDTCAGLYDLFVSGRIDDAEALNERIVGLNRVVSGTNGVASVKAAMDMAGFYGGLPRRPMRGITTIERDELKRELVERGFLT